MAREITIRSQNGPPWGSFVQSERSLNMAALLRRSIFTQQGRVSFSGSLLTMSRFLLGLDGVWYGSLRVADQVFSWPDSLRKGFAEDLGLVLTTVMAENFGWDGYGPQFADLDSQYWGKANNRPDLVFTISGGLQVLGEAKGSVRQNNVVHSPPSREQRDWLSELQVWGDEFACKWFLAATWANQREIVVDLFDPGEPTQLLPPELLNIAIRTREAQIGESAPRYDEITTASQGLRGTWASLPPSSSDAPPTSLFLGVVDAPFGEPVERVDENVQISAHGRLVVVVRRDDADEGKPTVADAWRYIGGSQSSPTRPQVQIVRDNGIAAAGVLLDSGELEVFLGSTVRAFPAHSLRPHSRRLRRALRADGTLVPFDEHLLIFTKNFKFTSPTAAAEQVLGQAANGRKAWILTLSDEPIGPRL